MSNSDSNFCNSLRARMFGHAQAAKLDEKILEVAHTIYEQGLQKENVVLSRSEKERLFRQTVQTVLLNILANSMIPNNYRPLSVVCRL